MASAPGSDVAEDSEDLYVLLNVDRTADSKEIRVAYLRLALCLHPDKATARHAEAQQRDDGGPVLDAPSRLASLRRVRQRADEQFVRVEQAYRVLSDPIKRQIYNEFGRDGLAAFERTEMAKQVVGDPLKHPAEVRQLLDRLLQEAAQRRQDAALGTFGAIVAECACVPFIGADGRLIKRNLFPDMTRLMVRQAVKVPLSDKTHFTCGGYSLHHSGMGVGSMYISSQHDLSPAQWVGSLVQIGHQPKVGVSCASSNNSNGRSVQAQFTYEPDTGVGYRMSTSERLDPLTTVDVSWGVGGGGGEDAATVQVARAVGEGVGTVMGELSMGGPDWDDLGLRLSYRHMKSLARNFQISGKVGSRGMEVELDSRRFLPRQVKVKSALRLSERGVAAVLSLQRGAMIFEFPVLLSTAFTGWSLTVGGIIPALADAGVGWMLSSAWRNRAARLRAEGEPLRQRRLLRAWKDAANQSRLMLQMSSRSRAEEEDNGGLIIVCARYGSELSVDCGECWWTRAPELSAAVATEEERPDGSAMAELASAPNVNVTMPLQFFVKNSSLTLPPASKSSLLGFYTPASCRDRARNGNFWGHVWEGEGWDIFEHSAFGERNGTAGSPVPVAARLYVRYSFAGRMFEETFGDTAEVVLPSATSTFMGGGEVR